MPLTSGPTGDANQPRPAWRDRWLVLVLVAGLVVTGCGDGTAATSSGEPTALPSALPSLEATLDPMAPEASLDLAAELCAMVGVLQVRVDGLAAVELRLPNLVALDIEMGKFEAAFSELRQAELGDQDGRLSAPLKRLGYRLQELELAIEDFRTNPRPKRAVPHVEDAIGGMDDALSTFALLASC